MTTHRLPIHTVAVHTLTLTEAGVADLKGEKRGGKGRFSISLPLDAIRRLDAIADTRGAKRGAIVREAVLYFLRHCPGIREVAV